MNCPEGAREATLGCAPPAIPRNGHPYGGQRTASKGAPSSAPFGGTFPLGGGRLSGRTMCAPTAGNGPLRPPAKPSPLPGEIGPGASRAAGRGYRFSSRSNAWSRRVFSASP